MHTEHGHAGVYRRDVAVAHVHGHSAAAALVDLAQLAHLPLHVLLAQYAAHEGHQLGRGVVGAGLAARAGELVQSDAVVELGGVALLAHVGVVGVEGRRDVRADADAVGKAVVQLAARGLAELVHEPLEGLALHAGHAVGAGLLLVCEDADGRAARRALQVKERLELGVGADAVVVAVAAYQAAVEADVAHVEGGHGVQLGGHQVFLGDAVLAVEYAHDGQLDAVFAVVVIRRAADEDVHALGLYRLAELLGHLLAREVGQQVADHELRVAAVAADDHVYDLAALERDGAVYLQGDGRPLVLFDAAVVVRLEEGQLVVLVERELLEVEPRGVHVRRGDDRARAHRLAAHDGQQQRLAAVGVVDLVAGLERHAGHVLSEALGLGQLDRVAHALALGAGFVQVPLVSLAVGVHGLAAFEGQAVIAVLLLIKELCAVVFLFFHFVLPP